MFYFINTTVIKIKSCHIKANQYMRKRKMNLIAIKTKPLV